MSRVIPVSDPIPEKIPSMEDVYINEKVTEAQELLNIRLSEEKNRLYTEYLNQLASMRSSAKTLILDIIRVVLRQELQNENTLARQIDGLLRGDFLIAHIPKGMEKLKESLEEKGLSVIEEDRVGVLISGKEIIDTDPKWILPLLAEIIAND